MKPIYVLNGPNLNRLGKREPAIYGTTTLAEVEQICRSAAGDRPVVFHQTNSEEKLIDWIHEAIDEGAGILINPAAWNSAASCGAVDRSSLGISTTSASSSRPASLR